jgi:ubiquitin-protein ligase
MSSVRLRRLQADYEKLQNYVRQHPRITLIRAEGEPPESYQLEYRLRSLRHVNGELTRATNHMVEINLPASYPRLPPQCRMLTPIFHPNIAPHAICIGDHWSAGEPLWSIVGRIGEMIAYQSYNIKSPLNGEAARWVSEHEHRLPLDPVSLLVEERPASEDAPPLPPEACPTAPPQPEAVRVIPCSRCGVGLRIRGSGETRRVRCPKCLAIMTVA